MHERTSLRSAVLVAASLMVALIGGPASAGVQPGGTICSDGTIVYNQPCPSVTPALSAFAVALDPLNQSSTSYVAGTWTAKTVRVNFFCTGLTAAECPPGRNITESTELVTETVTDSFGRTVSASFGPIRIDRTAPTAAFTNCPTGPIGLGTNVTLNWAATDGPGSGVAGTVSGAIPVDTSAVTVMTATTPAPVDTAGNVGTSASCAYEVVQAPPPDTTPPVVTYTLSPALPGTDGWYNTPVTLTWNVSEPQTGQYQTLGCVDKTVSAEQLTQSYTCQAFSTGGESAVVTVHLGYDSVPPVVGTPVLTTGRTVFALRENAGLPQVLATDQLVADPAVRYELGVGCLGPDTNVLGAGSVICTARDRAGNLGAASLDFQVTNALLGITSPKQASAVRAGSLVTVTFRVARDYTGAPQISNATTRVTIGTNTVACPFVTRTLTYTCKVAVPTAKGIYPILVAQDVGASGSPLWVPMANAAGVTTNGNGMTITAR